MIFFRKCVTVWKSRGRRFSLTESSTIDTAIADGAAARGVGPGLGIVVRVDLRLLERDVMDGDNPRQRGDIADEACQLVIGAGFQLDLAGLQQRHTGGQGQFGDLAAVLF